MTPSQEQITNDYLENELRALDLQLELLELEEAEEKRAKEAAKQREINRQNARKSTGPRTEAGKAASSKNRLSHGLCSSSLLVFGETQAEFDELHNGVQAQFNPVTPEEMLLTSQLTEALWRLNRARRVESATFDRMMDETDRLLSQSGTIETAQSTGDQLGACFFDAENRKVMASLQRYVTAAERTYRQSLKALQEALKRRPETAIETPAQAEQPKVAAASATLTFESGFESQFAPNRSENAPAYTDRR
jgi:hypothetical protein